MSEIIDEIEILSSDDNSVASSDVEMIGVEISPSVQASPTGVKGGNVVRSIFTLVRGRKAKEQIALKWATDYVDNKEGAVVDFLQFVLEASGSRIQLSRTMKFPLNYATIIKRAAMEFPVSQSYPLIARGALELMKHIFTFIRLFMKCVDSTRIIQDNWMFPHVTEFLMECSESEVRAIRHTATLIALKVLTCLSDIKSLQLKKRESHWMNIFNRVFVERYRDVVDDIRMFCMIECGVWLSKYPQCFLAISDLEYLAVGLADKAVKVIEASLKTLVTLFDKPELQDDCMNLAIRNRDTILNLIPHHENEISELAIKFITRMYINSPESLSEDQCNVIEELLFCVHRGVAQAVGELFYQRHLVPLEGNAAQICYMVRFFIKKHEHGHAAYFVDALYGTSSALMDWECMVRMLLDTKCGLNSSERSTLIELMSRCVKQAVSGEIPPGRYTKDLIRIPLPASSSLSTTALGPSLGRLIRLYLNCERHEDLINLIELPQYIDLQQQIGNTETRVSFYEMFDQLNDVVFNVNDIEVLRMAASTLSAIFEVEDPQNTVLDYHFKTLFNNAATNYKLTTKAWKNDIKSCSELLNSSTPTTADRMMFNYRLITALYEHFDMSRFNLTTWVFTSLRNLVNNANEQALLPEDAIPLCLEICYCNICWHLHNIQDLAEKKESVVDECQLLTDNLESFFFAAFPIIQNATMPTKSRNTAYGFVCDLLTLFSEPLRQSLVPAIMAMEYKSTREEHQLLETYLLDQILKTSSEDLTSDPDHHFDTIQSNRSILVGYCKLVCYNIFPMMRACIVFQHYSEYYEFYGDILHSTLEQAMDINPINFGMTMLHTCITAYKSIREKSAIMEEMIKSSEFIALLRLARQLGQTFQCGMLKSRAGVVVLHRAGIMYAVKTGVPHPTDAPMNLSFLLVLAEFSRQLLVQDKRNVATFLKSCIEQPALPSCKLDEWKPLDAYRISLR